MDIIKQSHNGVFVIVTTPLVVELRNAIVAENFTDIPIDPFIQKRIELIMSETVMNFIEVPHEHAVLTTNLVEYLVLQLLNYLQQHVTILKIKEIYFLYHDTVFIHC